MLVGNRYVLLELLGKGGMGAVYRATDLLASQIIALKQVLLSSISHTGGDRHAEADTNLRLSLAREFQTLASLHHPHIIHVLDYGFDANQQPYFTMPLLENTQSITEAAGPLTAEGKIDLLVQLLQALAYMHRRGILHRDLKPGNVQVENREQVRVLDFGLAMALEQLPEDTAGTLAYMAPEAISRDKIGPATDLYAVGIMAYEMFAGRYPFETNHLPTLVHQILFKMPDMTLISADIVGHVSRESALMDTDADQTFIGLPGNITVKNDPDKTMPGLPDTLLAEDERTLAVIPPLDEFSSTMDVTASQEIVADWSARKSHEPTSGVDLIYIISRLLAKDPEARYQDAYAVIRDLASFLGKPMVEESRVIRESFLQAATFVGREPEMMQLKQALQVALHGTGSVWLVGGESGVGKSRLLDELRIEALVMGAIVVRGQSDEDGGTPYQLWREPLRRLVLSVDVSDTEAAVIKEIVPDINTLLQRDIPDPPVLEGKAKQQRLALTMIDVLKKQRTPTVILLEDLQWAKVGLLPIEQLTQIADQLPMLIVGNYRDDEAPNLAEQLPGVEHVKLPRLSNSEIVALSASMLGEAGKQPGIIRFLQRETEGNVFFMVEVVRALAEGVGRLSAVGAMELPEQILAGGIQQIIQRRLKRVPPEHRPLLKLAAIAGRQLDLSVLASLEPNADFETWLLICSNAAVLEQKDGNWRFSHDKLREVLIADMEFTERRALHAQMAHAIETTYPNDPTQARALLEHWHQVGETARERHYSSIAGELALSTSNFRDAISLFERALSLSKESEKALRATFLVKLGKASVNLSDYATASRHLNNGMALARETDHAAIVVEALNELGWVAEQQGDYEQAKLCALEALELSQQTNNQMGTAQALKNLGNVYRQRGSYEEAQKTYLESLAIREELDDHQGMAVVLNNLGITAYFRGDQQAASDYLTQALTIHREIGARYEIAAGLDNLGIITFSWGDADTAKQYFEQSLVIRRDIGDRSGIASALNNLGVLAKEQQLYEEATQYLAESLKIRRDIGDRRNAISSLNNLGAIAAAQGDLETARQHFREALEEARKLAATPLLLEALVELAGLHIRAGDYSQGASWLGTVLHHPSLDRNVQQIIDPIMTELRSKVDEADVEDALAQGQNLVLEEVVNEILDA